MKSHRILPVAIVLSVALPLCGSSSVRMESDLEPRNFEILWVKQQPHATAIVQAKAALHPDGTAVAYVSPSGDVVMDEIATGKHSVLVPRHPQMGDAADLAFSPDGRRVAFWRYDSSGGCPGSNIYAVDTDGRNLTQLTHTSPISTDLAVLIGATRPFCRRRFWRPKFSPDGSKILVCVTETVAKQNPQTKQFYDSTRGCVAIMASDGSGLEILVSDNASCLRSFWSADGRSIYFSALQEGGLALVKMDVATRATKFIKGDHRGLLGHRPDREWVAKHTGTGSIRWYDIEKGQFHPVGTWSVPAAKQVGDKRFQLHGFDWSPSGIVLLWYDDARSERFEVIRFTRGDPYAPQERPTKPRQPQDSGATEIH